MTRFKLVHALIFASIIIVACINASSQFRAIVINTKIPFGIRFLFLKKYIIIGIEFDSKLTSHWQTGFSQSVHPSKQFNSQGHAENYFKRLLRKLIEPEKCLQLVHSLPSLMHWLKQLVSSVGQSKMHRKRTASHLSMQTLLRSRTLN